MSKLRKSAKGMPCYVRVPGVCNGNPETTVLAHLNGGGMGMKHHDLFGAMACSACHQWIDVDYVKKTPRPTRDLLFYEGMQRTQQYWLDNGMVAVK